MWTNQNSYFLTCHLHVRDLFDAYINGEPLEFNNEAKYLGVTIDNKLTWRQHTENIEKKINKGIGIPKKMRHFLQEDTLASLFNAFVKPFVDYGSLTWRGTANTHLLKLKRTLNKAMRTMAFISKFESAKSLYIYYKILPLEANIKLTQGKFIWKLTHNQHPDCIQATNSSTAINDNEDNNRFVLPSFRTNTGRVSLAYQGIKLWVKEIPETIKKSATYSSFSKKLKHHFLEGNDLILRMTKSRKTSFTNINVCGYVSIVFHLT